MSNDETPTARLLKSIASVLRPTDTTFSIFSFYRPSENQITELLQVLLDPKGSHGHGDSFLRCLLDKLGFDADTTWVDVKRNSTTPELADTRFIDLTIQFQCGSWLAIENKPWASDQPKQVADYIQTLRLRSRASRPVSARVGNKYGLVYLSGDGHEPSSLLRTEIQELINHKILFVLSYARFADCLDEAARRCPDEYVKRFVFDLTAYFRQMFRVAGGNVMQLGETDKRIVNICVDDQNLAAALKIISLRSAIITNISQQFLQAFADEVRKSFGEQWQVGFLNVNMQPSLSLESQFTGLYIYRPEWHLSEIKYGIGFCNHSQDGELIVFGIYKGGKRNDVALDNGLVREKLDATFGVHAPNRQFDYWDWYIEIYKSPNYSRYSNWHTEPFLMRMGRDDERSGLTRELIELLKPVVETAADSISRAVPVDRRSSS